MEKESSTRRPIGVHPYTHTGAIRPEDNRLHREEVVDDGRIHASLPIIHETWWQTKGIFILFYFLFK